MASGRAPRTLRELRTERALTQEELAEHLVKHAREQGRGEWHFDAAMISKWERGVKGVSPRNRRHIAEFFGIKPDQLVTAARLDLVSSQRDADVEALQRTADGLIVASVPEAAPHLTVVRDFPAAEDLLHALDATTGYLAAIYPWAPARGLLAQVTGHLEAMESTARRLTGTAQRRAVAGVSEVALLAGQLEVHDLDRPVRARGYFIIALEAAREAGDDALTAAALGHVSVIPARELRYRAATAALQEAQACVRSGHPLIRAWLIAVESELLTGTGLPGAALEHLERAERLLEEDDPEHAPRWLDIDLAGLDGLRGLALMRLGRQQEACARLEQALGDLAGHAHKRRAVLLADLSAALSSNGLPGRARFVASQARAILDIIPYAVAAERLRGLG